MIEFKGHFSSWINEDIVIARVVKTWGSSPRPVGSTLVIDQELNMYGSVSGGCVEGAVLKEAKKLFSSKGGKMLGYGVTDEDAWSVGLSCGGRISVYIQKLADHEFKKALFGALEKNEGVSWYTVMDDTLEVIQSLVMENEVKAGAVLPEDQLAEIESAIGERNHRVLESENEPPIFIHLFPRKDQMLIIGAAHITADLIHLANYYGFESIVIDPREAFADKTSFDDPPSKIIKSYPSEVLENYKLDQSTYAVILSHDPKIDDNALQILLKANVAYIGALGSKKTHAKRIARLEEAGFSSSEIKRIHAPIGLSINAKTPREIALSIMGQIIEVKNQFK